MNNSDKTKSGKITYADAGVDVNRGYEVVKRIKNYAAETFNDSVLSGLGSFGGFYALDDKNVLVAGTDGVGTKLKYAIKSGRNDTIGIDAVAMCVNDVICQGAKPLFFLDYIATGRINPDVVADVVKGVAEGCKQSGCALIGGETAEMPSMYADGDYDLAGFTVGHVKYDEIINGANITAGKVLIGLKSSGLHSNGYSLIRKLLGEDTAKLAAQKIDGNKSLLDEVLIPTRLYVNTILTLKDKFKLLGVANITGGGFIENIPRIFPKGIGCKIDIKAYELPPIFKLLWDMSKLSVNEIYNTWNMGVGMVICVDKSDADAVIAECAACGDSAVVIGETVSGEGVAL